MILLSLCFPSLCVEELLLLHLGAGIVSLLIVILRPKSVEKFNSKILDLLSSTNWGLKSQPLGLQSSANQASLQFTYFKAFLSFLVFSKIGVIAIFSLSKLQGEVAFKGSYLFHLGVLLLALVYFLIWGFLAKNFIKSTFYSKLMENNKVIILSEVILIFYLYVLLLVEILAQSFRFYFEKYSKIKSSFKRVFLIATSSLLNPTMALAQPDLTSALTKESYTLIVAASPLEAFISSLLGLLASMATAAIIIKEHLGKTVVLENNVSNLEKHSLILEAAALKSKDEKLIEIAKNFKDHTKLAASSTSYEGQVSAIDLSNYDAIKFANQLVAINKGCELPDGLRGSAFKKPGSCR